MADRKPSSAEEYQRLRRILIGRDLDELEMLRARLDEPELRSEETSRILPRAVDLSANSSTQLRRSMQPVVEEGLRTFGRRDPQGFSDVLFPVIGPAVRKAVASSMQALIDGLSRTLEQSFSLKSVQWRLEAIRTGKSYGEIVLLRSALFRVEQAFLIHRDTGILIEHRTTDPAMARDAGLVSSMLTAIRDFVLDSFKVASGDELETVQFGELSIWIQGGPRALLACAVRGSAPTSLREVMQENLERIHFTHYEALEQFRGDVSRFSETRQYLDACMLGRAADSVRSRKVPWKPLLWTAALLLAGFAYWSWFDAQRWNTFLSRLSSQPGITVTESRRSFWGGTYRVAGLRDPLALEPASLLEGTGLNPANIVQRWDAHLSLDPTFAMRRALEQLERDLSRTVLRFETGKYVMGNEEDVEDAAAEIRRYLDLAEKTNRVGHIAVVGSADPLGPTDANRELSRRRAEWVRQRLIQMQVPAGALTEEADLSRTALRRRVTFRAFSEPRAGR
ncbi:hypothetical protein F183_A48430 [Bryobacterales bacterium F-183]|nr:hypothetical protein F183_A48430 [Bryobacterales bacterium F-183]